MLIVHLAEISNIIFSNGIDLFIKIILIINVLPADRPYTYW